MPARLGAGVARYALTVRLFHPLHLDGLCGAVYIVFLQVGCYCPQKNTVLTHRLLALRHVIPNGALIRRRLFAFVNVCIFNHLQL
jgi:hypothetical protein